MASTFEIEDDSPRISTHSGTDPGAGAGDGDGGASSGGGKLASLKQKAKKKKKTDGQSSAPASPATDGAAFTLDVGQRGDLKIKVNGIGGDGGEYKDETRLKELFEKMNLQVDQAKIRERVNENGVDTSYAVVTFHRAPDADAAMRAFENGDLPDSFTVEQFDMEMAANSRGAMLGMYESSPTLAEYEDDPEQTEFHSHDIFDILNNHVEEHFYGEELINPKCKTCLLYAIKPTDPHRLRWDAMMLVMVSWSSLYVPYDAAFRPEKPAGWVSWTLDTLFYADIVLNFFTGYDKGYIQIMEKGKIVRHYLKTWFFVDLLATVDWEIVVNIAVDSATPSDTPIWVKMLALIKIFRLLRAGRLIDKLAVEWHTDSGLVDALKFFLYVTVVAHLLGCFFFLWPVIFTMGEECAEDPGVSAAVHECINDPSCDATDGVGWYYEGQCRQNGWRQAYGLETICLPQLCSGHTPGTKFEENTLSYNFDLYEDLGETCPDAAGNRYKPQAMTEDEETEFLLRCLNTAENRLLSHDPGFQRCPTCMRPFRLYIDALYWSLTTMTTIGYGDRGPSTENELYYVLFAEIFGLAFFALLLTQIDRVNIILGKSKQAVKDRKDGVLQFALNRRLPDNLIKESIKFMNFRAASLSGNAYSDDRDGFDMLSENLRTRIKQAVYMSKLKEICFFGWDEKLDPEEEQVRRFFDDTDTDNGGKLERDEVRTLFTRLDIAMNEKHFDICWGELDRKDNGSVSFDEFSWWWFLTKYGVPRISSGVRCPLPFLEELCSTLQPRPFAKGERLVDLGNYGDYFVLSLTGKLCVKRPGLRWGTPGSGPDDEGRNDRRDFVITPEDREPIFGFSACLTKAQHDYVKNRTDFWVVDAIDYADTLWVTRQDFYKCFGQLWPEGRKDMVELCYYHYQIGLILNGRSDLDM